MLNLVQLQEQLKGLPMQAVMQYANGQNPQVPPYVALAELNRRKQIESAAAGMQQAPQQTVADQLKGTMAPMAMPQAVPGFAEGGMPGDVEGENVNPFKQLLRFIGKGSDRLLRDGKTIEEYYKNDPSFAKAGGAEGTWDYATPEAPKLGSKDSVRGTTPAAKAEGIKALVQEVVASKKPKAAKDVTTEDAKASAPNGYLEAYKKAVDAQNPGAGKSPEDMAAEVKRIREMFGITEPGGEQAKRLDAMDQILAQRNALYKKQQEGRGGDNIIQMIRAYAQAPRGNAFGAAAGEGSRLRKEQNAADLSETDRQLVMSMKMAELRELNEAKMQAFREGNLALYNKLDAEQKAKQQAYKTLQTEQAGNIYKVEREREGRLQEVEAQGRNQKEVARIRTSGSGGGRAELEQAKLINRAVNEAEKLLEKDIMYQTMPEAQKEAYRLRKVEERLAYIMKQGAAPTASQGKPLPETISLGQMK